MTPAARDTHRLATMEKREMNTTLSFTAVTSGGQAFDIDFPLHPATRSADGVADLLADMLASLSHHLEDQHALSDGDVLQALAMLLAIRARMTSPNAEAIEALVIQLFRDAHDAVCRASSYRAGRA